MNTPSRKPVAREVIMARNAKAAATKLAKRIPLICKHCSKEWMEKPSHAWRQYCSRECHRIGLTKAQEFPCPRCGKMIHRKPCEAHRHCPDCIKLNVSERNKMRGVSPRLYMNDDAKQRQANATRTDQNRKRVSALFKDKNPTSPSLRKFSPNHCKAVECFFRDPSNVIHYCRNISRFVHDNPHLFKAEDLIQKKHTSKSNFRNATNGLSTIHRGSRTTWKGWTLVSNREGRERYDLIGRNWMEPTLNLPASPPSSRASSPPPPPPAAVLVQ